MHTEVDIEQPEALRNYLVATSRITTEEHPAIRVLAGGVSNRTVWLERANGDAWVLKQALAKLRVQVDWFSSPERIQREALGMRWLAQLAPPETITPLIFEDHEQHLLAMQAVPLPHENWKTLLLAGQVSMHHVEQFGYLLGTIQRKATERGDEIRTIFSDRSFFETLRLEPYYGFTATRVPAAASFLHQLIDENRSHCLTLVHGDYSPKNVLVHRDKLLLLDHEVIHYGDPAFDLGFAMTHFLSKAHHLPQHRQSFIAATRYFWQTYVQGLGDVAWKGAVEQRAVRNTLGCMLARVAGRSPLEYLSSEEKARQQEAIVALIADVPATVEQLIQQFIEKLEKLEKVS